MTRLGAPQGAGVMHSTETTADQDLIAIRARGRSEPVVVGKASELATVLPDVLQDGDLLLMMGAGDIGAVASHIAVEGFKAEGEA